MQDALLGVSHEVFWRLFASIGTVFACVVGYLCRLGVGYLGKIAVDLSTLKTTAAVVFERTEAHAERLKSLETAVFNSGKSVS